GLMVTAIRSPARQADFGVEAEERLAVADDLFAQADGQEALIGKLAGAVEDALERRPAVAGRNLDGAPAARPRPIDQSPRRAAAASSPRRGAWLRASCSTAAAMSSCQVSRPGANRVRSAKKRASARKAGRS